MADDQTYPIAWDNFTCGFVIGDTTQCKILVDVAAAGLIAAVSGEVALPYGTTVESAVRQRIQRGGQRALGGSGCFISSTDGSAKSALIYVGRLGTSLTTGTNTITSQNVITRAAGSFLTDGFRRGDTVMLFGTSTAANEGVLGTVTGAVTATTITVNGTPWTNDAALAATTRIFKVSLYTRRAVPANSGNTDSAPNVIFFGGTQDPGMSALPDQGLQLGPNGVVIVGLVATTSAAPAAVQFAASVGYY